MSTWVSASAWENDDVWNVSVNSQELPSCLSRMHCSFISVCGLGFILGAAYNMASPHPVNWAVVMIPLWLFCLSLCCMPFCKWKRTHEDPTWVVIVWPRPGCFVNFYTMTLFPYDKSCLLSLSLYSHLYVSLFVCSQLSNRWAATVVYFSYPAVVASAAMVPYLSSGGVPRRIALLFIPFWIIDGLTVCAITFVSFTLVIREAQVDRLRL